MNGIFESACARLRVSYLHRCIVCIVGQPKTEPFAVRLGHRLWNRVTNGRIAVEDGPLVFVSLSRK